MTRYARQKCEYVADYAIGETGYAAQIGKALIVDRNILRGEKAPEHQRVKKFLVGPTRQECGDFDVANDARREQVAQVDDSVRLDIHHVGDREQRVVAEAWLRRGPM